MHAYIEEHSIVHKPTRRQKAVIGGLVAVVFDEHAFREEIVQLLGHSP